MFDTNNLLDALERLTTTGVNTYNAVRGADANVKPAKPDATATGAGFFTKRNVIIGVAVIVVGFVAWRALKKKG